MKRMLVSSPRQASLAVVLLTLASTWASSPVHALSTSCTYARKVVKDSDALIKDGQRAATKAVNAYRRGHRGPIWDNTPLSIEVANKVFGANLDVYRQRASMYRAAANEIADSDLSGEFLSAARFYDKVIDAGERVLKKQDGHYSWIATAQLNYQIYWHLLAVIPKHESSLHSAVHSCA